MKNIVTKIIVLSVIMVVSCANIIAADFKNENLKYVISYKWGLIHKDAGEANLILNRSGNVYNIMLTAKTKPWADKIYQVRDTLKGTIRVSDLKPLTYHKLTHEKGEYKKDEITYSHTGAKTVGKAKRYRKDKKTANWNITEKTFTADGPTFDMLSIFYYLRQLNYSELVKNKTYTASIFSGKEKENIKIRCLGKEKIKLKNNTEREAYHIKFNFTRSGGKKSSDDIDTWISTDPSHIPLYLVGKLPVGEVRAYFIGS